MFAAKEQGDDGSTGILLHIINFFLKETSERSKSCSRSYKNNFFPFHSISKSGFSELSSDTLGFLKEKLRDETVFHQTGNNNNIFLSFSMRGDGEQPWSHWIRKFNKIFKGKFNFKFLDNSKQIVPVLGICFLADSFELFRCFYWAVINKILRIFALEFW